MSALRQGVSAVSAAASMLLLSPAVLGQSYPSKPIRVLVNSAPAGLTVVVARLVTTRMSHHVPYKGGGPALNDVLAGHVPVYFDTLNTSVKLVQENKLRALAIVSPARSPALPAVPTLAEAGYPEVRGMAWFAMMAPSQTPREVVAKLNEQANEALNAPEIRERLISLGGTVEGGPPGVLADLVRSKMPRWSRLIRERGITMQ